MSRFYPVLVDLQGKKALVVGGGKVAQRKIETLLEHGATVQVVAKELTASLEELRRAGRIEFLGEEFSETFVDGVFVVFAATDDAALNRRVSRTAQQRSLLVNAVDQPADCNFIVPSVLSRGDLVIAVSTSGKSPAFARKVRVELEQSFGEEYGLFLNLMGNLRKEILRLGLSQEENKSTFEDLVTSDLLTVIREKNWDLASQIIEKVLGRPVSRNQMLDLLEAE
ncbi:MAG TPA: bifunctional precorrin-2 dehydrogenase/sirohydrochlorin ferrochelatase [Desulfatiglandales bacterium]|nr:bifunctional precorrin-2 dehydrogenase/sirohydrochlorin ferrochelatase [Desulfatiglandales bacterium]